MKKFIVILLAAIMLSGCTSTTQFGQCIGIADDKNPELVYKLSVWNTFLAIVFSETIIVPIVVLVDETFCPVGTKTPLKTPLL